MVSHYTHINEDELYAIQADYDPRFKEHRPTGAPPPMERENETAYRRRLAEALQQHAPHCKDFNIRHSTGTAFDALENQIKADAHQESLHPTMIPDGELREVKRVDGSGRPYSLFYGSPRAWLDQFAAPKRRLVHIRTHTDHGFNPGNLG